MSNFDLLTARFLYHPQKFNYIHNAGHFPSFPLIPTPLLCNQHKPLQKNHWQLLLTFVSNFSFAHIQTDGLHTNNSVVSPSSSAFFVCWLDFQCRKCHGMNTHTKLKLGLIVVLGYTRVLLHLPFFCIYIFLSMTISVLSYTWLGFHAIYYNIAKTTRKGILLAFNTSMK